MIRSIRVEFASLEMQLNFSLFLFSILFNASISLKSKHQWVDKVHERNVTALKKFRICFRRDFPSRKQKMYKKNRHLWNIVRIDINNWKKLFTIFLAFNTRIVFENSFPLFAIAEFSELLVQ